MLLDSNWILCYQTRYLHQLFEISFYDQRPCFSFAFLSFKENFQYHYLHIISVSLRFSFRAKSSTEFTQQQMHTTFLCLTISINSTAMIWLISVIQFFFYFVNCFFWWPCLFHSQSFNILLTWFLWFFGLYGLRFLMQSLCSGKFFPILYSELKAGRIIKDWKWTHTRAQHTHAHVQGQYFLILLISQANVY